MNGQHGVPALRPDTQQATERRSPRYRFSEDMAVQCPGGTLITGISVEISQGGMSAMVNGCPRSGPSAHKLGLLYGFEFTEISAAQVRQIAENGKKSYAWRLRARNT